MSNFEASYNDWWLRYLLWYLRTNDKSTLVQVMAWCRQATSDYLSQCWPRSLSPYDVIRPQWVKAWSSLGSTITLWHTHEFQVEFCPYFSWQNTSLNYAMVKLSPYLRIIWQLNNNLAGLWLNCISSVEITLFLLADILLQHRALFQC